jgi:hypothetical protein
MQLTDAGVQQPLYSTNCIHCTVDVLGGARRRELSREVGVRDDAIVVGGPRTIDPCRWTVSIDCQHQRKSLLQLFHDTVHGSLHGC